MNDERFFDLAMKAIARQAAPSERAELDAALANHPARQAEWERLQSEARLARDIVPILNATDATGGEFRSYARESLQTRVRETLGRPSAPPRSKGWGWRLFLVLTPVCAVLLGLANVMILKVRAPVIQVAVLDVAGVSRGTETNVTALLSQQWRGATVRSFEQPSELTDWEKEWPVGSAAATVIYDRIAGEVRVMDAPGASLSRAFSRWSRTCPRFCIRPMSLSKNSSNEIWSFLESGLHRPHGPPSKRKVAAPAVNAENGVNLLMRTEIRSLNSAGSPVLAGGAIALAAGRLE